MVSRVLFVAPPQAMVQDGGQALICTPFLLVPSEVRSASLLFPAQGGPTPKEASSGGSQEARSSWHL